MRFLALAGVLALSPAMAVAGSQGDWFASLYTGDGVELRNDERVFTLFAVFNALGFDQGPVTRKEPVPKITYHPVRQTVRGRVIGGDPEVRKAAEAFFDAHPSSLRTYLSYAVAGGQPPFKDEGKTVAELKGFNAVLAKAWAGWKLEDLMGQVQAEYRKTLKTYLPVIDKPLAKTREALKVPEATETLLVVNLLDAHDQVRAVPGDGVVFVIVGPAEKPNVDGLLREFARVWVEPVVAKKASSWAGGPTLLREAQLAGAPEQTVADYATSLISAAVAMRSIDADDAAYEAAAARGYFGLKDVAKMFDEGRPLDAWVMDALQKVETRRPAKK
ncbi:MAG: hypothetical protein JNG84_09300 [Archangium sp.]|nr:hypothetical protein [Archangium sp.]